MLCCLRGSGCLQVRRQAWHQCALLCGTLCARCNAVPDAHDMLSAAGSKQAVIVWRVGHFGAAKLCAPLRRRLLHSMTRSTAAVSGEAGTVKLVLIGDVHHLWNEADALALKHLQPDVALFVGDFGEEVVELVQAIKQQVDAHNIPAAYILGNHDAWHSLNKKDLSGAEDPRLAGTKAQLEILGQDHVGYSYKQFPAHKLSVVGGRPFSAGGSSWNRAARFNHIMYGVGSMKASADRICECITQQPPEHAVVVMAHNGPAGLGDQQHDICGRDWLDKAGDHGDPDLQEALAKVAHARRPVPLAVFGHMHHILKGGIRQRQMVHIDADSGTVFVNCAVVPRWSEVQGSQSQQVPGSLHHFTTVNIAADQYVADVSHVWVNVNGSQCEISHSENLVWTQSFTNGQLLRTCLMTGGVAVTADSAPHCEHIVSEHC